MRVSTLLHYINEAYEDEGKPQPPDPIIRLATNYSIEAEVASVYLVGKEIWVDLVPKFGSKVKHKPFSRTK